MNATLLENPDRTVCPSRREVELSALVEQVLGEVSQLRGEVAELRQQVGYWKGMFEQAKRKNEKLQKEIDSLRAENRQLKDRLFAAKSEKKPSKRCHIAYLAVVGAGLRGDSGSQRRIVLSPGG